MSPVTLSRVIGLLYGTSYNTGKNPSLIGLQRRLNIGRKRIVSIIGPWVCADFIGRVFGYR